MRAGDHQGDLDRRPQIGSAKSGKQMPGADRRVIAAPLAENLRLVDMPPDPDNKDRRDQADGEQRAPGDRLRQKRIESRVDECGDAPADGPPGLHQADGATAVLVADDLAHQHGAGRPFAAKAEPVQRAQDEQLLEILRERAQEGEYGVP